MYQEVSTNDKPVEHLGRAHGNRVGVPGRDGVRLPDVCYVGSRPGWAQGESSATGLGEEVFTWHRRKQPISESAKNEEAGWSQHPVPFTGLDYGKNFFFLKRVIVILSMQSNAHYLISTLPTATSNIVLPL